MMDKNEFLIQTFITLREEIKATKARLFWIVAMGLFGMPLVTYAAQNANKFVSLLVPYLVLVLIIMFLSEQNALMRAGRYVREEIEPQLSENGCWESWLESREQLRLLDRHFFACFVLVFFIYYFMAIGNAMQHLADDNIGPLGNRSWVIGISVSYGIGALWALATLLHHWRSCTRTMGRAEK